MTHDRTLVANPPSDAQGIARRRITLPGNRSNNPPPNHGCWVTSPEQRRVLSAERRRVERFEGDERARVVATLRLLVPIAGGKGLAVQVF
jgi:hypothetical protein